MTPPKFIPAQLVPDADSPTGVRWEGYPVSGVITSPFGAYESVRAANGWGPHNGVDIWRWDINGSILRAVYPGVVIWAFGDGVAPGIDEGSLGSFVVIRHELPGYTDNRGAPIPVFTGYAHMLETPLVQPGEWVEQGQAVGLVGYSGTVNPPGPTGAHQHFVVMEGLGLFNREYDTFYDPASLAGADLLPVKKPLPAIGSTPPPITEQQSTEMQYVMGKGAIVLPVSVEDTMEDYTLYVLGQEPKTIPVGTRTSWYTVLVPSDPDPSWKGR